MNKTLFFCFIIFINVLSRISANAHTTWEWGVGNKVGGIESYLLAVDKTGNVFSSGGAEGPFSTFGKDTVYDYGAFDQSIVTKTDPGGNFLWAKGSSKGDAYYNSITTDAEGNLYVTGYYFDSVTLDTFTLRNTAGEINSGVFLAKYSPSGNVLWAENIVPSGLNPDGYVAVDGNDFVYVAGNFNCPKLIIGIDTLVNSDPSRAPGMDVFVAKFDPSGTPVSGKGFGRVGNENAVGIAVSPTGNVYVTGIFDSDTLDIGGTTLHGNPGEPFDPITAGNNFFTRLDKNGNIIWAQELSYHFDLPISQAIATDALENVYLAGGFDTTVSIGSSVLFTAGGMDAFIAKFDSSGKLRWATTSGDTLDESANSISVDVCGKVWMSGSLYDVPPVGYTLHFGADTLGFYWTAGDPMFMAEYDTGGTHLMSLNMISGGDDANGIAVDNRGNFFLGGDYTDLKVVFGSDTLSEFGDEYLFAAKYNYANSCVCYTSSAPIPNFTNTGDSVVNFTYTGSTSYDSIKWDFGDGDTSANVNPVHTYTASGVYYVCVTIYSPCSVDGSFTRYCHDDTVSLVGRGITGINNITGVHDVTLFPNPAGNELTIDASYTISNISLSNFTGQILYSGEQNSRTVMLNVADLTAGVYFVKINGTDYRKFVKQ